MNVGDPGGTARRLIVALDVDDRDAAARLLDALHPDVTWFKIGARLFTREGPAVCDLVVDRGARLFLDLKYHDIPHTVAGAVRAAVDLGADMLTVHASGGEAMLRAAVEAVAASGRPGALVVAVTVLTHLDVAEFGALFSSRRVGADAVLALADAARRAGVPGVVASARELPLIKSRLGTGFRVVTPGIRLPDAAADDQTRVVTPEAAIRDGADWIVVGRPIIAAPDPAAAARTVLARMAAAGGGK